MPSTRSEARRQRGRPAYLAGLAAAMVALELQYLFEIGRTCEPADPVLEELSAEIGLEVGDLPFPRVMTHALANDLTRDPFDRLIVAQAEAREAVLLTADETVLESYSRAAWTS